MELQLQHQSFHRGSNFSTPSPTLVIFFLSFLIIVILKGVKWYLIVVLICISLIQINYYVLNIYLFGCA